MTALTQDAGNCDLEVSFYTRKNPSEALENETFLLLSFVQKTFVPFPFTCHKACAFAKFRLVF